MAAEVIWSDAALNDLAFASDYIARDSRAYAATFVGAVFEAAEGLALFPEAAGIVPEIDSGTIREVFVQRYRLIYEFDGGRVLIVACIHSARDLSRILQTRIPPVDEN